MRIFYRGVVALLRPEYWYTTSNDDMSNKIVQAYKYFLGLNKIGSVEVDIDTSGCKASAWHEFASSADDAIVEWKIGVLAV